MSIKQNGGVFGRNPTFNDVTIDGTLTFDGDIDINSDLKINGDLDVIGGMTVDTNVLVVDKASNKVGIQTLSPAYDLDVPIVGHNSTSEILVTGGNATSNDYTQAALLRLRATSINPNAPTHNDAASVAEIRLNHTNLAGNASSGYISFLTNPSNNANPTIEAMRIDASQNVSVSTGNLVIGTSGSGIDFSATAGTGTSELLDDYEEGTWSPFFEDAGSVTYTTTPYGSYTKIGRTVHVQASISWSAFTASGNLRLGGLPFAPVAVGNSINSLNVVVDTNNTAFKTVSEYISTGIMFFRSNTASASSNPYGASGSIIVSGTYLA